MTIQVRNWRFKFEFDDSSWKMMIQVRKRRFKFEIGGSYSKLVVKIENRAKVQKYRSIWKRRHILEIAAKKRNISHAAVMPSTSLIPQKSKKKKSKTPGLVVLNHRLKRLSRHFRLR